MPFAGYRPLSTSILRRRFRPYRKSGQIVFVLAAGRLARHARLMRIMGAILAGGQARRFGSDKALAMLGDRTLIDHARAALDPHVEAVVICGRADGIADRPEPGLGPLGGINAALHHARAKGFDAVLTTGCDMPAYPAELAAALIGEGAAILKDQPLAGFWPVGLADALDAHLAQDNDRSVRGWMKRVDARIVDRPDILLPNINRPEDLAALARGGRG